MRTPIFTIITLASISLVGCNTPPKPNSNSASSLGATGISLFSVNDARSTYDSLTDLTERYRQVLISQRTVANVASTELHNAIQEWNDPFLDELARSSVRTRTWVAIQQLELAVSDYAPVGTRIDKSKKPRSKSSMTPMSAKHWHNSLNRQLGEFQVEHMGRWTRIGSSRNQVETSIDEWEAYMDADDIAEFFQQETGTFLGELTQIVDSYKPSHGV